MVKVVLLGDDGMLQHLIDPLTSHNLSNIALRMPEEDFTNKENLMTLDFTNFHNLTIALLDIYPDVIIYLSPVLLGLKRSEEVELELLEILELLELELEMVVHLLESMQMVNPHFIYLIPENIHFNKDDAESLMTEIVIRLAEIKKYTLIKYPLGDSISALSPLDLDFLGKQIANIIHTRNYGNFE